MKMATLSLAVATVTACLVAGCGASADPGPPSTGGGPPTTPVAAGSSVAVRDVAPLGRIMVGGTGRTLYVFGGDPVGTAICESACARAWPPYLVSGVPRPGDSGVTTAGMLGTVRRSDGAIQLTYGGRSMYYFAGDTGPGVATGQGLSQFGASWYVVGLDGRPLGMP
jgi:predicted lipoprotein with Yx(FWY)xxD motif